MFGEFVPLVGEWLGAERAPVSFSDGDEPSAKIGDTDVTFEAFRGLRREADHRQHAAFGFAPVFTLGKSSGSSGLFGESFEASYGDAAESPGFLGWDQAGRYVAGGVILAAAIYQLTPLKDVCLSKCRSPFAFLLTAWRPARRARCGWESSTGVGAWVVAGR